jgi:type I restriction enzyme S subunit
VSLTLSPAQIIAESASPLVVAPSTWSRRPLGEVATILNGYAFESRYFAAESGKPLIRIRDISSDRTVVGYVGSYDKRYLVQPGSLVVGMDGDFNCARWRGPEALLNQRVCKITPQAEALDLGFLTHVLPGYLQAIQAVTSSTTVAHLSSRDVAKIPIPLPVIGKQRELANLFDVASEKRDSSLGHIRDARRAVAHLREAVLDAAYSGRLTADWRERRDESAEPLLDDLQRSFAAATRRERTSKTVEASVTDLEVEDVPPTWRLAPLKVLCDRDRPITYGILKPGPNIEGGVPYVRVTDFKTGTVFLSAIKRTSEKIAHEYRRSTLRSGDLLYAIRGTFGHVAVVPPELDGANITQDTARLAMDPRVSSRFVLLALRSPHAQSRVQRAAKGVAVQGVNLGDLRELLMPLPPIAEQEEIARRVDRLLELADHISEQVAASERRADRILLAVLAKAFRGDLVET